MDYDEPDLDRISADALGISEQSWIAIMEMLAREKYIDGVTVKRSTDGNVTSRFRIRASRSGGWSTCKKTRLCRRQLGLPKESPRSLHDLIRHQGRRSNPPPFHFGGDTP